MTRKKQTKYFYLFILPWIIGFIVFTIYPMVSSLYFSLTKYDVVTAPQFVGLENYKMMLNDSTLRISIKATLLYTLINVPIGLLLSLMLAMLLNSAQKFKGLFRTLLYLPSMVSGVSLSLLWSWIFNPEYGIANYLLGKLGIKGPMWLMDEKWAVPSLAIMGFWSIGTGIVLFLAALQGVPRNLIEASILDGANWFDRLKNVTLPMISPVFLFQLIIEFINSFQVFTQAFVMTKGGPHYATTFYVYYIYQNAFVNFKMGYASALSWVLLFVIMIITALILRFSDRFVYYEGGER